MKNSALKLKSCKQCNDIFMPIKPMQVVCSPLCGYDYAKQKKQASRKRLFDAETRRRKVEMKTRSDWLREAQTVFNKYVRLRDNGKPCISCDKPDNGQHQRHASHFKSTGSNSALRFNLWNVHASCSSCNNHLSGNIGEYTPRLVKKIGQDKYDWLLTQNQTVKYEIDYIKRLKRVFAKRARLLENRINQ